MTAFTLHPFVYNRLVPVVRCHAKINWMLRVLGRRADGYHELETIFQSISLHDTLRIDPASAFSFQCDDPLIPTDERNLVVQAWRVLAVRFGAPPVSIELEKRIPAGGGLGGGSCDAAMTLLTLRSFFGLPIDDSVLRQIALELGSDVPFFLIGGTVYARGRGELLEPLADLPEIPLLLAFPEERVMTGEAFGNLREGRDHDSVVPAIGAATANAALRPLAEESSVLINDLEAPVFRMRPRLGLLRTEVEAQRAIWSRMTGSGSTIVGAFRDVPSRDAALVALEAYVRTQSATTIDRSVAINALINEGERE